MMAVSLPAATQSDLINGTELVRSRSRIRNEEKTQWRLHSLKFSVRHNTL